MLTLQHSQRFDQEQHRRSLKPGDSKEEQVLQPDRRLDHRVKQQQEVKHHLASLMLDQNLTQPYSREPR